ncbi:MAG: aspartate aminotransferase family protein [Verrucomicrobiales bacterium]|nr:aspartate aminotransferase family protein [Verrucomicrobiales bacterium]|tara:strand:- start:8117 stop:9361 length:1245 start_codon:yes stop_codon:yes gene_type:complete
MNELKSLYEQYVVPTYGRFDVAFERGAGSQLWDFDGKRYVDMGCGIAVCSLGHAHPELSDALSAQARKLVHVSNLYYTEPQATLAKQLVDLTGVGKMFFCNSGAEANEGLYKLARRFGHESGRFEIITAHNSFHGRTMAGIAATGQEKVKIGFGPVMEGFTQVPFNDLEAVEKALSPATVAVMIEGVQGEGGITPATSEYLLGLRKFCDVNNLLLLMDAVQCGFFRTGNWQSYQTILSRDEVKSFQPDAISMAKSLGGGFPIGSFWITEKHADLLGPGSHGTTFGGTPLACAMASKIIEIVERDNLAGNAVAMGSLLKDELNVIAEAHPNVINTVRGLGLMIGVELQNDIPDFQNSETPASIQMVNKLHDACLILIPAGTNVVRFLPALNLTQADAEEALGIFRDTVAELAGKK